MKRLLSLILTLALLLSIMPTNLFSITVSASAGESLSEFAGGSGTESDPYLIATKEHLNNVRNHLYAHYKMIADIEFSDVDFAEGGAFYNNGTGWKPIAGEKISTYTSTAFRGVFDGNEHKIKGLYINSLEENGYFGLFGILKQGTVKNLGMEDCNITTYSVAGSIAGSLSDDASISNCYNTGNISGCYAGGIAGVGEKVTISNCYNIGTVVALHTFPSDYSSYVTYNSRAAGIVGNVSLSSIINCYNAGNISSIAPLTKYSVTYAGGIAADTSNTIITNCYNTGNISVTVEASFNSGNNIPYAGGISGESLSSSEISNCYNFGNISVLQLDGTKYYSGGISGLNTGSAAIVNCYNVGKQSVKTTTSTSSSPSGIIGALNYDGSVTNCYCLDDGSSNTSFGKKCSLEEMQTQSTFDGLDFDTVWFIDHEDGIKYPQLKDNQHYKALSIEITQLPNKLTYLEGDSFDQSGMIVTAHYDNNFSKAVTDYTIIGYSAIPGKKTITISHYGQSATFDVEVTPKELTHIAVTTKPDKLEYFEEESFDKTGMIVTAYYNNGTKEIISDYSLSTSPSTPGSKKITIEYKGKTESFDITYKYVVTFKDWDGSIIATTMCRWGDVITVPANPTRASDNTYTYEFAGWDKSVITSCTGNATYTAQYTSNYIDYTIVFKNWDNTVISAETYHWGDVIVTPNSPTKEANNIYTYTFAGWDSEVVNCAGDAIYKATFFSDYIDYKVVFKNWDETILSVGIYHWGNVVTAPTTPAKLATKTYTYAFAGWDKTVVDCAGDTTYTATYTSNYIDYTVVFKNWDGSVISTKTYHYGDAVVAPANPSRDADRIYTYVFAGWDKKVDICEGNTTYTATYAPSFIDYTVTFKNWNDDVLSTQTYHYGDTVTVPSNPTKEADKTYTYTFTGWDKNVVECVGHTTYTATFTPIYIDYTVTFKNWNGDVLSTQTYHYGDTITAPSNPTKKADNTYIYNFAGWDKTVTNCDGDAVYIATYSNLLIGDTNDDGKTNSKDCALIMQYINGWDVDIDTTTADVNGDNKINSKDYVLLMRYLNGWNVEFKQ